MKRLAISALTLLLAAAGGAALADRDHPRGPDGDNGKWGHGGPHGAYRHPPALGPGVHHDPRHIPHRIPHHIPHQIPHNTPHNISHHRPHQSPQHYYGRDDFDPLDSALIGAAISYGLFYGDGYGDRYRHGYGYEYDVQRCVAQYCTNYPILPRPGSTDVMGCYRIIRYADGHERRERVPDSACN